MFQIGDQIVHPMHGAGVVDNIIERTIDGEIKQYYSLKFPVGEMQVMVPVATSEKIGVRPIMAAAEAERVMTAIPGIRIEMDVNWNRRYRDNLEKLKSGNMMLVAEVMKGLLLRDQIRTLSTGERKMLHSARQILISELALSTRTVFEDVEKRVNEAVYS